MGLTPMMRQYLEVKESCKDCILFFRLGDFYEMFFEDAKVASKELELVLTGRDCGLEERAPMCGIPYHAANTYIGRLVSAGYKIAICEQLEDPSASKGIVKRGIIKIITPGTYTDSSFLEENKNNYIMSFYLDDNMCAMSFADISTGEFNSTHSNFKEAVVLDEISKFAPREIVLEENIKESFIHTIKERFPNISISKIKEENFDYNIDNNLKEQFNNFNENEYETIVKKSANGLLYYIFHTQKNILSNINKIDYYSIVDYLTIDVNSRRNLEITENLREKTKKSSLLWVLDKTNTAMGGRQLRRWIEQPLINKNPIENRLNAVEELLNNISLQEDLKEDLKSIYDIERIVGKVASKSVNAKELISLKCSIGKVPYIKKYLSNFKSDLFLNMEQCVDTLEDIHKLLDKALLDNPSLSVKEGNIIKEGFNEEVDSLREAKSNGKKWIASLEQKEKEETGIKSLKVSYNKVFGYFIEITKANLNLVPEGRYIRKQTLSNAERYITPELKEMEEKILGAEEKLIDIEYKLFTKIRDFIEENIDRMQKTARIISDIDCLCSLATVALENNYIKPNINAKDEILIEEGRHPVVEKVIPKGEFISNDSLIDTKENQLILITGPNMAGKSTYMRQVALITIMAQIGSFVPAKKANISICDKIFTRIGASDDLAAGKSTFMVEMWEVSNILKNATWKSLVLLDEVGRGTSTYDGLSIAWSVIEYICNNKNLRCKTLFATHYHELTKLEDNIEGVKNYSVSVSELENEIVFLRKIIRGGADQSYGIEVAKLAGLPSPVINRAKEILQHIEGDKEENSLNIAPSKEYKSKDYIEVSKDTLNTKNNLGSEIKHDTLSETNAAAIVEDESTKEHLSSNKKQINCRINDEKSIKKEVAVDSFQINFEYIKRDKIIEEIKNIDILNMTPMEGFNKLYDIINKTKDID
ncbi:DNA mismatch repair protein MutS [Clostridium botulinum]|uniref:DNA mismatch repair protein MutS n=1 Tax=Clostridium botulinum TaxID=1491 RepID=UPI001375D4FB|nr:DNA mismatch repair protein MutS [Clostridium botulinum]NCI22484.1 DNA mismatch repair protein MutS [Clostridium botulinum]NCI37914.1 DNA mismatch repair protein MutS [Clostridium botulinum]NCI74972.1 DNA mismatch repair protein MutS [Clostridium botulinum]NDI41249.1 DNA mismatch repair protein MutS [Clostridium botulinum]